MKTDKLGFPILDEIPEGWEEYRKDFVFYRKVFSRNIPRAFWMVHIENTPQAGRIPEDPEKPRDSYLIIRSGNSDSQNPHMGDREGHFHRKDYPNLQAGRIPSHKNGTVKKGGLALQERYPEPWQFRMYLNGERAEGLGLYLEEVIPLLDHSYKEEVAKYARRVSRLQ